MATVGEALDLLRDCDLQETADERSSREELISRLERFSPGTTLSKDVPDLQTALKLKVKEDKKGKAVIDHVKEGDEVKESILHLE